MSRHATPDGKEFKYEGELRGIPKGYEIVFNDGSNLIKEGDMLYSGAKYAFKNLKYYSAKGVIEVGKLIDGKICVIRKITKAEIKKPEVKEKPVQRLNKEDFLKSINGL